MTTEQPGHVPVGELRDLVKLWREGLEWAQEHEEICSNEAMNVGESKIEELEAVIERYED